MWQEYLPTTLQEPLNHHEAPWSPITVYMLLMVRQELCIHQRRLNFPSYWIRLTSCRDKSFLFQPTKLQVFHYTGEYFHFRIRASLPINNTPISKHIRRASYHTAQLSSSHNDEFISNSTTNHLLFSSSSSCFKRRQIFSHYSPFRCPNSGQYSPKSE